MEILFKDNGKMINYMALENMYIKMDRHIKDIGRMIYKMDMELKNISINGFMMEISKMD